MLLWAFWVSFLQPIAESGLGTLLSYGKLIALLVGSMLFDALIINPIIVFLNIRENPYPLVLKCLKDSGITAFLYQKLGGEYSRQHEAL